MRIFVFFLSVVLLISLCGCAADDRQEGIEFQTSYLFEKSEANDICVAYPMVVSDKNGEVSTAIYQFVHQEINRLCIDGCRLTTAEEKPVEASTEYNCCFLELDYQVALCTNTMISLVFEGLYNHRNTAHPIHVFFTVNLDPSNGQKIQFTDGYVVDDVLYDTFSQYAEKDIIEKAGGTWPENWGTFSEDICDKECFLDGLATERDFHVYYTKEGVGISYPVPYVMGDHMEVLLPYSELHKTGK